MDSIFNRSGGYRKLYSFNFATIVHLGAIAFCKRFIPWQEDPLGKVVGQMVGAARSGRINIAEGSERAGTSTETEIKLTDVARASLAELQNDLETWLAERELIPWSIANPEHQRRTFQPARNAVSRCGDATRRKDPSGDAQVIRIAKPPANARGKDSRLPTPDARWTAPGGNPPTSRES